MAVGIAAGRRRRRLVAGDERASGFGSGGKKPAAENSRAVMVGDGPADGFVGGVDRGDVVAAGEADAGTDEGGDGGGDEAQCHGEQCIARIVDGRGGLAGEVHGTGGGVLGRGQCGLAAALRPGQRLDDVDGSDGETPAARQVGQRDRCGERRGDVVLDGWRRGRPGAAGEQNQPGGRGRAAPSRGRSDFRRQRRSAWSRPAQVRPDHALSHRALRPIPLPACGWPMSQGMARGRGRRRRFPPRPAPRRDGRRRGHTRRPAPGRAAAAARGAGGQRART